MGACPPTSLHVNAAELLREPGLRRHVSAVVAPIDVGAEHDAIAGDIDAELAHRVDARRPLRHGDDRVPWQGSCRRCLAPLGETIVVDVDERYAEQPAEHDDAFPIEHGQIDLAPMVREHVLLGSRRPPLVPPRLPRSVPEVRCRPHVRPVRL